MTQWNPFRFPAGLLAVDTRTHVITALQLANHRGCWTVTASACVDVNPTETNTTPWVQLRQQLGLSKRRKAKTTSALCTSGIITKQVRAESTPYDDGAAGAQIVRDAEQIFPCAIDELGYDYRPWGEHQLRIDAAKLVALNAHIEPLQAAQFEPLIVEPSDEALLRAVRFFGPHCAPELVRADHALALLELSDDGLHWLVIHQHEVIFSRQHLGSQPAANVAAIVHTWLQQYQQQALPALTSIALTGEPALQDDNAEMPQLQMQLHQLAQLPVWLFDPFIQAPTVCQVKSAPFQHHRRGAYIRALGLALRNHHTWRG